METRILIADQHTIVREAIGKLIEKRKDFLVIGGASDGHEAINLAERLQPDIILTEITLPRLSGLEVTRRLVGIPNRMKVLILSVHDSQSHVEQALLAGATGILSKTCSGDELMQAIDTVKTGQRYLSAQAAQHVISAITGGGATSRAGSRDLTSREREVLQLIAEGCSNKETATVLNISIRTVESHRSNLMAKLDIQKTPGLVRFAIREGMLGP